MKTSVVVLAVLSLAILVSVSGRNVVQARDVWPGPDGVIATDGIHPGEAVITWSTVEKAAYYRIGWVAQADREVGTDGDAKWREGFVFADVANRGQASHLITGLAPGVEYDFVVASHDGRWSRLPGTGGLASLRLGEDPSYFRLFDSAEAEVALEPVEEGRYRRIGWIAKEAYRNAVDGDGDWRRSVQFVDLANRGQTSQVITGLKLGAEYYVAVASHDDPWGVTGWPDAGEWELVTARSAWQSVSFQNSEACAAQDMVPLPTSFEEGIARYLCQDDAGENYWIFVPTAYTDPDAVVEQLHGRAFDELGEVDNRVEAYRNLIVEVASQKALGERSHLSTFFDFNEGSRGPITAADEIIGDVIDAYALRYQEDSQQYRDLENHLRYLLEHPDIYDDQPFGSIEFDAAIMAAVSRTIFIDMTREHVRLLEQLPMDSAWTKAIEEAQEILNRKSSGDDLTEWGEALEKYHAEIVLGLHLVAEVGAHVAAHAIGTALGIAKFPVVVALSAVVFVGFQVYERIHETNEFWDDLTLATVAAQAYWHTHRNRRDDGALTSAVRGALLGYTEFSFYQHLYLAADNPRTGASPIGIGNLGETDPSEFVQTLLERRDLVLARLIDSAWEPTRDFKPLYDATGLPSLSRLIGPTGMWSDGDTMWVSEDTGTTLRAFDMETKLWTGELDFDTARPYDGISFTDIWSDGETMWIAARLLLGQGSTRGGVYAYDVSSQQNDATQSLYTLPSGNHRPWGVWSDGTTIWVSNTSVGKIFAYDLGTRQRDRAKEFDGLRVAGNDSPHGIWSDEKTMWVADREDDKVYAYDLATARRDTTREFNLVNVPGVVTNTEPGGIWSDGTSMWVIDGAERKIFAYDLPEAPATVEAFPFGRDLAGDLGRLNATENHHAEGIWSDGTTMWVADHDDDRIYAYRLSDGARDEELEFDLYNRSLFEGNHHARGIWSDGTTMWVADHDDDRIYAYRLSDGERVEELELGDEVLKAAGNEYATGIWFDATAMMMWVADRSDDLIYGYDYGYDTASKTLVRTIDTLKAAGNHDAEGIWSDGATMWVADRDDNHIYAYQLSDGARVHELEFNTPDPAGNHDMKGIGSDGTIMWAVDQENTWIYAYNMPAIDQATPFEAQWGRLEIDPPALGPEGGSVTVRVFTQEPSDPDYVATAPTIHAIIPREIAVPGATNRWDGDVGPCSIATKVREDHTEYCWQATFQGVPANARRDTVVNGNATSGALVYEVRVESEHIQGTAPAGSFSVAGRSPFSSDRELLEALYDATDGDNWYSQNYTGRDTDEDWLTRRDIGDWHGVTANANNRVTRLELRRNYLLGELPDEVGYLEYLEILDLTSNNMVKVGWENDDWTGVDGEIPETLGRLGSLTHLDLSVNDLSGSIPAELGNLQMLQELKLDDNRLSGEIPPGLGNMQSLQSLDLSDNRLSGQIPAELTLLSNLTKLHLDGNQFTGCIPASLENIHDNDLSELDLPPCDDAPAIVNTIVHISARDFNGLTDAENDDPSGIWSNGTTMWVADVRGEKIYAYDLASKARVTGEDFDTLYAADNYNPRGLWSDGSTMWVVDYSDEKIYAYDMTSKARVADKDFNTLSAAGNDSPRGIWSDGVTMWVSHSSEDKIYAYDMTSKARVADKDFDTLELAKNDNPRGIWSDGSIMWVADASDEKLYAYDLETTLRVPSRDYDSLSAAGNFDPEGIWSDGTTMWVADDTTSKIYAYGPEPPLGDPSGFAAIPGREPGEVVLNWTPGLSATQHQVYFQRAGDPGGGYWPGLLSGDANSATISGFTVGSTHLFWVRAGRVPDSGATEWSNWSHWARTVSGGTPFPLRPDAPESDADRNALMALFNATGGSTWKNNTNWLSSEHIGNWDGVGTDYYGRVVRLGLSDNQLTGNLPAELANLEKLLYLALDRNELEGEIPADLANVTNLRNLHLGHNQLTGEIPEELDSLSNLVSLDLGSNQLTGAIPEELGNLSNLGTLSLNSNEINGEIPDTLGNLSNLSSLYLRSNQLSGEIPAELGNLSKLTYLDVASNQLSGAIPGELASLSDLETLWLFSNELTGEIPATLGNLSNLRSLFLSENQLSDEIPDTLGNLSNLTQLGLSANQLSGEIPATLGGLSNLTWLFLDDNQLTGQIPVSLSSLTSLERLLLNSNQLTGEIPAALGNLSNLQRLYLGSNALTGCIPASLGNVTDNDFDDLGLSFCEAASEQEVLVALYNATNGANWTNNASWLSDASIDEWHGVTTDDEGRVTRINLAQNGLTGQLPESLGDLEHLTNLTLWGNELSGEIPSAFARLSRLRALDLGGNEFAGPLPSWLGDLSNLTYLSLWGNEFTGSIPSELGNLSNLTTLDIRDNQLAGSIPSELGNLTNLEILWLRRNNLTGPIPDELANLSSLKQFWLSHNPLTVPVPVWLGNLTKLEVILLADNKLTGSIPASLGKLSNLKRLSLNGNDLSGSIPSDLAKLSKLEGLSLTYNNLTGAIPAELGNLSNLKSLELQENQLTGPIPPELGDLASLEELALWSNQLTGTLPSELSNLSSLERFAVGGNQLSGPIPTWLGDLTNLYSLHLTSNQFTGAIPQELSQLTKLGYLNLGGNQLTGSIPTWLGGMPTLDRVMLFENQLTGSIPAELGNLTNLRVLWLYDNQLTGAIPPGLGNLTKLEQLSLRVNQLSGSIPSELGSLPNLTLLILHTNQLTGSIPATLGNLTNLKGLYLLNNQLTGQIPASLGNLINLEELYLNNNKLTGSIPSSLANLRNLVKLVIAANDFTGCIAAALFNVPEHDLDELELPTC